MTHYLKKGLFEKMLNLKDIDSDLFTAWQIILADDTLCPLLREDRIDVYYRGAKAFSLLEGRIEKNPESFDNSILEYSIPAKINAKKFPQYLPYLKQNIDLWIGAGKKRAYEREFSQMILRENNSKKAGNLSDYFIIDMEHQYKKGGVIPDLIGLIMIRGKRRPPVFRMSIIEVKYMDEAFTGSAGIRKHIDDYIKLLENKETLESLKQDICEMFYQSKELDLLPGHKDAYNRIRISDDRPELLFALISRNTNNGKKNREIKVESLKSILEGAVKEYGNLLEDTYMAETAELGFGLYADRKTKLKDFYKSL